MQARRLRISGLVQGVGYRVSMIREARFHGASGWVRNCQDGSVEAHICGNDAVIAAMIAWSRRGPTGARVEQVFVEEEAPEADLKDFRQAPSV